MVRCFLGNDVSRELGWLVGPWRAYLKRLSPPPSSHWVQCTLIQCADNRDPCMQRWVARTKVIAILLLMYPISNILVGQSYLTNYQCTPGALNKTHSRQIFLCRTHVFRTYIVRCQLKQLYRRKRQLLQMCTAVRPFCDMMLQMSEYSLVRNIH